MRLSAQCVALCAVLGLSSATPGPARHAGACRPHRHQRTHLHCRRRTSVRLGACRARRQGRSSSAQRVKRSFYADRTRTSSTPPGKRSSPEWSTRTRISSGSATFLRSIDLTDTRSYDEIVSRVACAREGRAGRPVGDRPRLGSEQMGRHALPDARSAVAQSRRTIRSCSSASTATHCSRTRRRCAPPASPPRRRIRPAVASSAARTASRPACSSTTRWASSIASFRRCRTTR